MADLKQRLVETLNAAEAILINPDGPAALARIEELEGALAAAQNADAEATAYLRARLATAVSALEEIDAVQSDPYQIAFEALAALKGEERNG